jgi:hypothetical protein
MLAGRSCMSQLSYTIAYIDEDIDENYCTDIDSRHLYPHTLLSSGWLSHLPKKCF